PEVAGKAPSRLEPAFLTVQSSIGWEDRIDQEYSVSCVEQWSHRLRKDLSLPAQAIVKREVGSDRPFLLSKQSIIFILNVRGARRRNAGYPARYSVLQEEQQRTTCRRRTGWTGCWGSYKCSI